MSVSVIMTCYNEGAWIEAAVRSVTSQTRGDLITQIIIADDGSDAPTLRVLERLAQTDERIEVIFGAGGLRVAGNRNLAATRCRGDYLALLDGDDLWTPRKLELQVPILERDPGVGLVYCDYFAFAGDDLDGARIAGVRNISRARSLTRAYFLNDPPIIPSSVLMRRSVFQAVKGFDASLKLFEDTDFYLRLSRRCRFGIVREPLVYKRSHAVSMTGAATGSGDLIAHHAYVALRFAADDPSMLPLVPRRLAERARKLGNHRFLLGDSRSATGLLGLAVRLDRTNFRAWLSWLVVKLHSRPLDAALRRVLKARRMSMGLGEGGKA